MILLSFFFALGFAAIHLFIGRLPIAGPVPRSVWLSAAGGISVAYVFLHLLPELAAHSETVETGLEMEKELAETIIFLVALVGLTSFYGLEKLVKSKRRGASGADVQVFMIHLGSFAAYNALIGYLLVQRESQGWAELALYGAAMATHFLSADFGLWLDHVGRYERFGRWLLAGAVLSGWGVAQLFVVSDIVIGLLFAFLVGGTILNVMKEELPEERQSRFWAFLLGVAGYSVILAFV